MMRVVRAKAWLAAAAAALLAIGASRAGGSSRPREVRRHRRIGQPPGRPGLARCGPGPAVPGRPHRHRADDRCMGRQHPDDGALRQLRRRDQCREQCGGNGADACRLEGAGGRREVAPRPPRADQRQGAGMVGAALRRVRRPGGRRAAPYRARRGRQRALHQRLVDPDDGGARGTGRAREGAPRCRRRSARHQRSRRRRIRLGDAQRAREHRESGRHARALRRRGAIAGELRSAGALEPGAEPARRADQGNAHGGGQRSPHAGAPDGLSPRRPRSAPDGRGGAGRSSAGRAAGGRDHGAARGSRARKAQ